MEVLEKICHSGLSGISLNQRIHPYPQRLVVASFHAVRWRIGAIASWLGYFKANQQPANDGT